MRTWLIVVLISLYLSAARAQVFEVTGGSSSLYQAQGASFSEKTPNFNASVGGGLLEGKFVGGANATRTVGETQYIMGDDYIPFILPTDLFDTSHYLVAVGAGLKEKIAGADIFSFAGALSNDFSTPLFEGVRAESPAGILFFDKTLTPGLKLSSRTVFSSHMTSIQGVDWTPNKQTRMALSGGIGGGTPYGAASITLTKPWLDLKAAYIQAGPQFHRVVVQMPMLSEPDKENVVATIKPAKYFSVSAGHQNFLSPIGTTQDQIRTTVNEGTATLQIAKAALAGSIFQSVYKGASDIATAYTADRDITSAIHVSGSYLVSRASKEPKIRDFICTTTERLTPRLNVSEMINRSQGQTTASFGGGILSNLVSITAEYQTYYVPVRRPSPFEEALILDIQLHLVRGLTLHGATFVAPDGSQQYTADAQAMFVRQQGASDGFGAGGGIGAAMGKKIIQGRVVDTTGRPVVGAALLIDQRVVYTNDDGVFMVRERTTHTHTFQVALDQFLDPGSYRVISAPNEVRGSDDGDAMPVVVTLEKVSRQTSKE